jgi:hypothetical protein
MNEFKLVNKDFRFFLYAAPSSLVPLSASPWTHPIVGTQIVLFNSKDLSLIDVNKLFILFSWALNDSSFVPPAPYTNIRV